MMPQAFDHIAADYDEKFTDSPAGRLQREKVWQLLEEAFSDGFPQTILEINCGTGADALWLAQKGSSVLATDISGEMLAVAQRKAEKAGTAIEYAVLPIEEISRLKGRRFELVFSNFGGLNCLSPEKLVQLNNELPSLLSPGGRFVSVVMGRFCAWETLYFILKGRFTNALRRRAKGPVPAALGSGIFVDTWYYAPNEFAALFPNFKLRGIKPVGFWAPPSCLDPIFRKMPALLGLLGLMERRLCPDFLARGSDHYWICLEIIP